MDYDQIKYSGHAVRQMFERSISREALLYVLKNGEVIAEYPEDKPFPSQLLFGWWEEKPLHIVSAYDDEHRECIIITVYEPEVDIWEGDFKKRKVQ